ncbi:MAG TPA: type I-C CRISPR-associated protein Cas5c [Kiritimatiellia bacterium]|nr:type I-C CRISPR-associated protein Cas5c [Kiritimatiellia bacterium]
MNKERNSIEFKVSGRYALFSDPITRVGGEKFTYQVPTYQALVGIAESIYWKPTFLWVIDALRVMKKIQTESKGIKTLQMDGIYPSMRNPAKKKEAGISDLSYYTYLRDVEYQVLAHFEWNFKRPELEADRDENKHHHIAKRCVTKGGRRDIFLGTRECQAYVEPCAFGEGAGFYDDYGELDFGVMFHGFDYPGETGKAKFGKRLWRAKMKDGLIEFPRPDDLRLLRETIRPMEAKRFAVGRNFSLLENDSSLADLLAEEQA